MVQKGLTLEIKLMATYSIMLLIACASTLHSILMKWHPPNYDFEKMSGSKVGQHDG